ncbi:GH92 family glycosyl hydrolase [Amycolatopsis acidiphila]|uniref:Glycoside hydrolase family 92 protein n=1 Tax=Amycolatopsis acidiphila TaxID=715473 RepID=A0A557ZXY0_9PSEU|nr:GH92 family glycosyl hydrolase [Amycolatopsis acidiphila]TVT16860.1 glycoside hydrolase family 92 protein [Amycolatopsis acidiphila]UIJ58707.1 GH92 family glycosyl hydrolase [Amycolatopsis acidiphila]
MPAVQADAAPAQDLAKWVNPFVGTRPGGEDQGTGGGAGNTFPGAVVPFGMVQWSPDTVTEQHGGYYYDSTALKGFSLTHLSGAGCDTYEDIPFIPYAGQVTTSPATDPGRYTLPFSHVNEQATAGKYAVKLDSGVNVELSATQRTGSGRFSYPQNSPATLLINSSGSIMGTDDAQVTIGRDSVSGWASSGRFCGTDSHYRVYFYAKFDTPFASIGTWRNGTVTPNQATANGGAQAKVAPQANVARSESKKPTNTTVSGPGSGGYVTFAPGAQVNVQVGVSFVSTDGAQANLKTENNHRSFDDVATAAREAWNDRLNQVQVTGGSDADKTTFYTALYHSLIQPNVFSDADGQYTGFDGRVHSADKGHAMYTNFSGWDIYRSEIQLLAMLAPKETSDIARSMTAYAAQGGSWDRWTVANDYTGVMNGDPYHIIVSSAYAFGAKDFDANNALLSMIRGATQPNTQGYTERPGLADYQNLGYVPGAGADTLEYTSADFSIAQLAQRLGDSSTYQNFMKRAQNWQNLYNPASGYLQPRQADGTFSTPYDPASSSGWVEGNGAQYSWMVPYDAAGLITAFGGDQAVQSRLDEFFTELNAGTADPHAFMGNEPNANAPWLYDFAGAPYKTQAIVRRAMTELYNPNPEGLVGNDDLGQMSSWYVWSALGMYPEIPGRAELVLGSPLFSKVVLTTGAGKKITISSSGAGQYVSTLKVNGATTTKPWLPESFVTTGGTLDYTLSGTPNTSWGSSPSDAPPSFREGETPARSFVDPARVVVPGGATGTAAVGAQDLSGTARTWHWTAAPPAGVTVTPSSGDLAVPAGGKAQANVTVSVAGGTAEGSYQVPITMSASGQSSLTATLGVLVAQPGSWLATVNNAGISPDAKPAAANFDGVGFSYSSDALAAAGAKAGSTVTVNGLSYSWPNYPAGSPDNVIAQGQTVNVSGSGQLAFLGAAANGNASGTVTVTYTDGTTSTANLGFSDWTLGAGAAQPAFGNQVAFRTPYRNSVGGDSQQINTYVFASAPIALAAGKTVKSVTLPSSVSGGQLHVFAIGIG